MSNALVLPVCVGKGKTVLRSELEGLTRGVVTNSVVTPSTEKDEARRCHPFRQSDREGPRWGRRLGAMGSIATIDRC